MIVKIENSAKFRQQRCLKVIPFPLFRTALHHSAALRRQAVNIDRTYRIRITACTAKHPAGKKVSDRESKDLSPSNEHQVS